MHRSRCQRVEGPYRLPNMLLHPVEQAWAANKCECLEAPRSIDSKKPEGTSALLSLLLSLLLHFLVLLCFWLLEVSQAGCTRHRAPLAQAAPSQVNTAVMDGYTKRGPHWLRLWTQRSLGLNRCYTWLKPAKLKLPSLRGYGQWMAMNGNDQDALHATSTAVQAEQAWARFTLRGSHTPTLGEECYGVMLGEKISGRSSTPNWSRVMLQNHNARVHETRLAKTRAQGSPQTSASHTMLSIVDCQLNAKEKNQRTNIRKSWQRKQSGPVSGS